MLFAVDVVRDEREVCVCVCVCVILMLFTVDVVRDEREMCVCVCVILMLFTVDVVRDERGECVSVCVCVCVRGMSLTAVADVCASVAHHGGVRSSFSRLFLVSVTMTPADEGQL